MLPSSISRLRGPVQPWICRACLTPRTARFATTSPARQDLQHAGTLQGDASEADAQNHSSKASPSPVIIRPIRPGESTKLYAKKRAAAEAWAKRADRIQEGKELCLWDIFEERGLIKDVAGSREAIRELMRLKRIGAYVGIDPTASSLHIGHLVPLMPVFWMYMHGYHSLTLLGSATAKIGDPTGRLKDRDKETSDILAKNMASMHYQLKKLWVNVDAMARRYGYKEEWAWKRSQRNNNEWWNKQPLLEFLQLLGANVRVGPMLAKDTVKRKLTEGDGLSFAELTYTLMQGWDWWTLYKQLGIQMQIGGSDQYGNIVQGVEAVKMVRSQRPEELHNVDISSQLEEIVGFTTPLLTSSSGEKIGKSTGGGNLWLSNIKTSAYDLYGYFVRRPDQDVERMLKLFTFIPSSSISEIMRGHEVDPSKRAAQHRLAFEVIALVHGMDVAESTQVEHKMLHGKGAASTVLHEHETSEQMLLNSAPQASLRLPRRLIDSGNLGRLLYAAGLSKSVSDGHRLATQQAVYIGGREGKMPMNFNLNYVPVKLWFPEDTKKFLIDDRLLILRKGKHDVRIIEFVSDEEYDASGETYPGQPYTGRVRNMKKVADLRQAMAEDELASSSAAAAATTTAAAAAAAAAAASAAAPPSDSKLQALRKQLAFFEENFDPAVHNPKSHPDKIKARIRRLEAQQKLFEQEDEYDAR